MRSYVNYAEGIKIVRLFMGHIGDIEEFKSDEEEEEENKDDKNKKAQLF
jgi:hypothetical protein